MEERQRKRHLGMWLFLLVLVGVAIWAGLNREWIYDYYRGVTYQPSAEMAKIRSDLKLTERGEFLFNAAQPVLSGSEEFNAHCRAGDTEIAILGCYTLGNIYVYNIIDEELNGIRELTAAHELLHVVFARMSEQEKSDLRMALEQVYTENEAVLAEDLETYEESERFEELYVRAGTEVAKLPATLEKHYAEIFKDQDWVVAYYDKYNGVFRALRAELDTLGAELDTMSTGIEQKMAEYERRLAQLNANIVSFNSCAGVAGCFETEAEFEAERGMLLAEQEALEAMYNEINEAVETYNTKVEIYNADVAYGEKLNTIINSNAKPREIK